MKLISKLMVSAASLLLVNGTVRAVLAANLRNGVYPLNADSIGIPLAETAELSMVGAALLVAVVGLSSLGRALRKGPSSRHWFLLAMSGLALAYLLAIGFFVLWGLSSLNPHHYLIVTSCAIAASAIFYLAAADYRSLRPNNSFKPKPLRGSA